jgi:hypothetical protein
MNLLNTPPEFQTSEESSLDITDFSASEDKTAQTYPIIGCHETHPVFA